jgi:hypothetical protein
MSLLDDIRNAKVRAAEDVVIADLRRKGLLDEQTEHPMNSPTPEAPVLPADCQLSQLEVKELLHELNTMPASEIGGSTLNKAHHLITVLLRSLSTPTAESEPPMGHVPVLFKPDGAWLNFDTETSSAMVNLNQIADERGPLVRRTIQSWINEKSNPPSHPALSKTD